MAGIVIVDYGMANLRSVQKAFERVGHAAAITSDPAVISGADRLVLPGVGAFQDAIARIDIPMWVARDPQKVNDLHALILEQCAMQGRNPYPYALTRADELAVVSSKDKAKLEEMIRLEWRLNKPDIDPLVISAKNFGKQVARSQKRLHEL